MASTEELSRLNIARIVGFFLQFCNAERAHSLMFYWELIWLAKDAVGKLSATSQPQIKR